METSDLRKAGLKVTLPRVQILEILARNHGRHLSAEDIYRALIEQSEDIGLATVYRVLTQFEAAQLVKRHHFEGGTAVFELNEGAHHDHIICMDCGRVEEFMDCGIERRQNDVANAPRIRDRGAQPDPLRPLPPRELPAPPQAQLSRRLSRPRPRPSAFRARVRAPCA